jgi:hypothetical protein
MGGGFPRDRARKDAPHKSMRRIDYVLGWVSVLLQLALAATLLWIAHSRALSELLAGNFGPTTAMDNPSVDLHRLISDYRQLLALARGIFTDSAMVLICSSVLVCIVLLRQRMLSSMSQRLQGRSDVPRKN